MKNKNFQTIRQAEALAKKKLEQVPLNGYKQE